MKNLTAILTILLFSVSSFAAKPSVTYHVEEYIVGDYVLEFTSKVVLDKNGHPVLKRALLRQLGEGNSHRVIYVDSFSSSFGDVGIYSILTKNNTDASQTFFSNLKLKLRVKRSTCYDKGCSLYQNREVVNEYSLIELTPFNKIYVE